MNVQTDYDRQLIYFTIESDEGEEAILHLAGRRVVCPRCDGTGVHDHPSFSDGIYLGDFYGPDWDEESRDLYRSGHLDVTCSVCHGERVTLEVDRDRSDRGVLKVYDDYLAEEAAHARLVAAERRAGC